jgi:outer membrane protein
VNIVIKTAALCAALLIAASGCAQTPPVATSTPAGQSANPVALGALKIGFVHNERLLRESPASLKVAAKIESEFAKRRAEVKALGDRIAEIQRQIDRNGLTMPEAERRVKERELTALSRDFQRTQTELRDDISTRENEELRGLAERANRVIRRIAEQEKFDIIFQQEAVVFVAPRVDLTDRVLKELGE